MMEEKKPAMIPEKLNLEQLIEKSRELKEQSKKTAENLAELQQDAKSLLVDTAPVSNTGEGNSSK